MEEECNHKRKIAEREFPYNVRLGKMEARTAIICKTCGIITHKYDKHEKVR